MASYRLAAILQAACVACLVQPLFGDGEDAWTYADQDAWVDQWPSCGVSGQQAPFDVRTDKAQIKAPAGGWPLEALAPGVQSLGPLVWNTTWPMANVSLSSGGGTWTVTLAKEYSATTRISLFGTDYHLESFHYHSPSEMWVDGRGYDMEVQLLHRSLDGRSLVLSVLLQVGLVKPNRFMSQILDDMPLPGDPPVHKYIYSPYSEAAVDGLPEDRTFFAFNASQSEPPCTLGTLWVVLKQPLIISYTQREQFRRVLNSTQSGVLRYEPCCPNGVIMPWAIDGDPDVGMNNRKIQNFPIQAVLASMAAKTASAPTDEPKESHMWVWGIAIALLLMLLGGLLVTVKLVCTTKDNEDVRNQHLDQRLRRAEAE